VLGVRRGEEAVGRMDSASSTLAGGGEGEGAEGGVGGVGVGLVLAWETVVQRFFLAMSEWVGDKGKRGGELIYI
jgi:hypothetical protein